MSNNTGPIFGEELPPETQLPMPSGMAELPHPEDISALHDLTALPDIQQLIGAYEAVSYHRNELQRRFDTLYASMLDSAASEEEA